MEEITVQRIQLLKNQLEKEINNPEKRTFDFYNNNGCTVSLRMSKQVISRLKSAAVGLAKPIQEIVAEALMDKVDELEKNHTSPFRVIPWNARLGGGNKKGSTMRSGKNLEIVTLYNELRRLLEKQPNLKEKEQKYTDQNRIY